MSHNVAVEKRYWPLEPIRPDRIAVRTRSPSSAFRIGPVPRPRTQVGTPPGTLAGVLTGTLSGVLACTLTGIS
jgi:hypothetical protein